MNMTHKSKQSQQGRDPTFNPASTSSVMDDHTLYRLTDLVNSDFEMSANDRDYKLDQEQIVKVCKILLHKINHNWNKNGQEYSHLHQAIQDDIEASERSVRSSMEEVN